jgi:hypothetical protein
MGGNLMRCVRLVLPVALAFVVNNTVAWSQEWQNVLTKDSIPGWEPKGGAAEDSWLVKDGVLKCTGKAKGRIGDHFTDWGIAWIGTKADYTDFALDFEFKLPPGANSGVFLRVPKKGHPTFDGMEVQILDDFAEEYKGVPPIQQCGALYKIAPPSKEMLKPTGQWNHMRVTAVGDHITVDLNGKKIVDANGKSNPEILKRSPRGPVGLQNHGTQLEFRNIRFADLTRNLKKQR